MRTFGVTCRRRSFGESVPQPSIQWSRSPRGAGLSGSLTKIWADNRGRLMIGSIFDETSCPDSYSSFSPIYGLANSTSPEILLSSKTVLNMWQT